jgi:hypothetical protein
MRRTRAALPGSGAAAMRQPRAGLCASFSPMGHPPAALLGSTARARLGSIRTLGVADRLVLFNAIMPVHCAFCIAGIVMSLAPIIFAPSFWFAGVLVASFFVFILGARWSVASLDDQERALAVFGLVWLAVSSTNCVAFVVGNLLYALCTDVPSAAVYTLACMTVRCMYGLPRLLGYSPSSCVDYILTPISHKQPPDPPLYPTPPRCRRWSLCICS